MVVLLSSSGLSDSNLAKFVKTFYFQTPENQKLHQKLQNYLVYICSKRTFASVLIRKGVISEKRIFIKFFIFKQTLCSS